MFCSLIFFTKKISSKKFAQQRWRSKKKNFRKKEAGRQDSRSRPCKLFTDSEKKT